MKRKVRNISPKIALTKGCLPIKNHYCPEKLLLTLFCKISHFVRNDNQVVFNRVWGWFAAKPQTNPKLLQIFAIYGNSECNEES